MDSYGIYPKQYRNALIPIEKNRCFVLMPFADDFDLIYGEIKGALTKAGFVCNRADELFGSVPIMGTVLQEILKAHFVIADLTGQNANVFYELGVAHSFKDAHNIILLAQRMDDVPFDIRHLGAIVYDKENLKQLTSRVRKAINDNSFYFDFFEVLQKKRVIASVSADMEEFVEIVSREFGPDLPSVTSIMNGELGRITDDLLRTVLDKSVGLLYSNSIRGPFDFLKGVLQILGELLIRTRNYEYSNDICKHVLFELTSVKFGRTEEEITHLRSLFAVQLASEAAFLEDSLTWIILYFSKSKTATVDLHRYHLERFLLTSQIPDVDIAIVNAALHENYYVREHMADMIGEKKIHAGLETLIAQLRRERNVYATASIITALGKLGRREAYPVLKEWVTKNEQRIVNTKHFFILKHLYLAFLNLGIRDEFVEQFESRYKGYIGPDAVF